MTLLILGGILVIGIIIIALGISSFTNKVEKEKVGLFRSNHDTSVVITEKDLDKLPELMRNYLIKTRVLGKPKYCNVILKQEGKIRTEAKENWLLFTATQYMSSQNPGFIWKAKALPMFIRDKYIGDKGEVRANFLGIKDVVLFSGPEVDQSSLGRYLGELMWFPIGFLDPDISWSAVDSNSVKATITKDDLILDGYFFFNKDGMIDYFKTKRYRNTFLENFVGEAGEYKNFDGLLIPKTMTGIWELKDEKLEYFNASILAYQLSNSSP